jgi:hypothetical protein
MDYPTLCPEQTTTEYAKCGDCHAFQEKLEYTSPFTGNTITVPSCCRLRSCAGLFNRALVKFETPACEFYDASPF